MPLPHEKTAAIRTPADLRFPYGNLGCSRKLSKSHLGHLPQMPFSKVSKTKAVSDPLQKACNKHHLEITLRSFWAPLFIYGFEMVFEDDIRCISKPF